MNLRDSKSRVFLMSSLPCARQLLQGLWMASLLHSHLPTLLGARGKDLKHIQPMLLKVVQGPADSDTGSSTTSTWQPTFIFPTGFSNTQVSFPTPLDWDQHNHAAEHNWWLGDAVHSTMSLHTQVLSLGKGSGGGEAETQTVLNKKCDMSKDSRTLGCLQSVQMTGCVMTEFCGAKTSSQLHITQCCGGNFYWTTLNKWP